MINFTQQFLILEVIFATKPPGLGLIYIIVRKNILVILLTNPFNISGLDTPITNKWHIDPQSYVCIIYDYIGY